MYPQRRSMLALALSVVCAVAPCALAASDSAEPLPRATVVWPDSTTTYHIRDMHGRMLTVEVPALTSPDIKVSDPVQGTVEATVMAVDGQTNQARVRTQEGQILVLTLSPETVMGMRVGDHVTLSVAQR